MISDEMESDETLYEMACRLTIEREALHAERDRIDAEQKVLHKKRKIWSEEFAVWRERLYNGEVYKETE